MARIDFDDVRLSDNALTLYMRIEQALALQSTRSKISKAFLSATTCLAPEDFNEAWEELKARDLLPKPLK